MTEISEKYPWISFKVDLRKIPFDVWMLLGECLSKCEHIKQIPLTPTVRDELHKVYLVKGVQATTAIEGNTLSENQVRQILDGKLQLADSKKYLQQEVQNIIDACYEIAGGLARDEYGTITNKLLCRLNEKVLQDVPCEEDVIPGKLRKHNVGVGTYRAPEWQDVSEMVSSFCEWMNSFGSSESRLNSKASAILKAIAAHLYIAWIHPFGDGNGRTARLIEFTILLGSGVPSPAAHLLSNHYNITRAEYYRQLDRTSKSGGDIMEFFRYAIEGLHDGLEEVIKIIVAQVQNLSWEHYVYDRFRKLPSKDSCKRQRNVLLQLSRVDRPLSVEEFEQLTAKIYLDVGKTRKTFTRDVNALIKMKLLVAKEGKFLPNLDLIAQHLPFTV